MSVDTAVAVLQAVLKFGGGARLSVDGVVGHQTRQAVQQASPLLLKQADAATMAVSGKSVSDLFPPMQQSNGFADVVVPAVVTAAKSASLNPIAVVAQVAFESGWGLSELSAKYFNYAGLKYNSVMSYPGLRPGSTNETTAEYIDGKRVSVSQGFATFESPKHFADVYVWYLTQSSSAYRYAGLAQANDPTEFFTILKKGGYATDPLYVAKLTSIVSSVQRRFANLA